MTAPRLCLVAPMLGTHPGWVPNTLERLAPMLESRGYEVRTASRVLNRYARAADIVRFVAGTRRNTDVMILHVFGGPSFVVEDAASRIARFHGHRLIGVMAGGALPDFGVRHPAWAKRVLSRFDLLVAPSPYLYEWAHGLGHPATVIPNPLPMERYPFLERRSLAPNLLWMRTFHEIYNPAMAVEVLADLRKDVPEVRLTMGGQEKGALAAVQQLAADLDVVDAVRFIGFFGDPEKQREFPLHDVFLNTNHIDNTPTSVLEAGAFGVPVVATEVGGIPHLFRDGETALLVPDGDAAAMAAAVRRLLDDDELAHRLSIEGRRLAEERDTPLVLDAWERVIRGSED